MTRARNIKLYFCLVCLASSLAAPAPGQQRVIGLDIIDMAAISRMSPHQLEVLAEGLAAEEIMRTKRSSAQALTSAVSKASSGLQSKVGFLGQASAGAASFIASASSKTGHDDHNGYSYEPHDEKVDFWGLKKSILYTLFQAVKAITGGVTILKGQLIKGGGHLATTLGKVIAVKGDAVSNLGKKIVSSAALSAKKPHSPPVYGPPAHVDYHPPPTGYGAPTAPAHFAHSAPSAPSGYAVHKYPAHLDGSGKLSGIHAGVVILTPLEQHSEHPPSYSHTGHTPLEPPSSLVNTVYSAIKNAFTPHPSGLAAEETNYQPPPPPPIPSFKPMSWGAVDSYGQPAATEAFPEYDPRNPHPPFNHAAAKKTVSPTKRVIVKSQGLTQDKIQKINQNLEKLNAYLNTNQRSSEELPKFDLGAYREMLMNGQIPLLPTPVVSDNEIGVLPADFLPDSTTTTSTTTTTTTEKTTTDKTTTEKKRERKDVKYYLRGNKIVVQG